AVDVVVRVQLVDQLEKLLLCRRLGQVVGIRPNSDVVAGLTLVADVDLGRAVVADQNDREARRTEPFCNSLLDFGCDFPAQRARDCLAVNDFRGHSVLRSRKARILAWPFLVSQGRMPKRRPGRGPKGGRTRTRAPRPARLTLAGVGPSHRVRSRRLDGDWSGHGAVW